MQWRDDRASISLSGGQAMTVKIRYLVILIVSFCYLQSAFEVCTDTIKNTWGDEYDSYIHADSKASQQGFKFGHLNDFALPPDFPRLQEIDFHVFAIVGDLHSFPDPPPHSLFLRNCSFLI